MISTDLASPTYIGDLGNGLVRRWSDASDTEKIGLLLASVHRDRADAPLNVRSQDFTRIIMQPDFPFMGPGDFAIVEDTNRPERPIVACTCFWRHQWSYAGIPFGVTRPEYVATDPAYRRRGLVRVLFEMIHARSAAEGHLLQAITGIFYFYRQFGYEYALDLVDIWGSRATYFSLIPERKEGEVEPYHLRPATVADIPHLMRLYNQRRNESLLWHETDEAYWRFRVTYWDRPAVQHGDVTQLGIKGRLFMICDLADQIVGYSWIMTRRWGASIYAAPELSLDAHIDRPALARSVLRLVRDQGLQTPAVDTDAPPCSEIVFSLEPDHPFFQLLGEALVPQSKRPYAWYIRIPDLPAFLRQITPVLEQRLAHSALSGYTGDLKIDLYRGGLYLRFEQGKLTQVDPWQPPLYGDEAMAGSPPLTFFQLILNYRSIDELKAIHPDLWANDQAKLLLDTLFPKMHSIVREPLV